MLVDVLIFVLVAGAGCFVAEKVIVSATALFAPLLPDDICGPDGWLMDTQRGAGIFDKADRV